MINLSHIDHKTLVCHLYINMISDFKRYYRAQHLSDDDSKACTAIIRSFAKLTKEEQQDRVVTFIAWKLPALIEDGVTLESYKNNQFDVLNTFKNTLVDQWRLHNTEHKHIVPMCVLQDNTNTEEDEMINLLENIPDTNESYDITIDKVWDIWTAYVKTLSGSQKMLSLFFVPGSKVGSPQLAKLMGKPERTIRYQIQKLEEGFRAYLNTNHPELLN